LPRMSDWRSLAGEIAKKSGIALPPGSLELLHKLQAIHVPEEAISFFREFEPEECAEIEGVRLWPIREVLAENSDYVPGCYRIQHGYVVFATTLFGDTFCFDTKVIRLQAEIPIVLIAHDWDWDAITAEAINRLKKPAAAHFEEFLQVYVSGNLDIQPNYDPFP
jgi:hypothetical protein